jgi:HTH-type transcriptional regulator/antitoxin HigA
MENKAIKTEVEYIKAVKELERIGDEPNFGDNPNDIKKFEALSDLIKKYENKYHLIEVGDPIEIIKLKMEYMGLTRNDLIPYMGSKGIVSEVFNKKRALSKSMIRGLSKYLDIDQSILNVDKDANDTEPNKTLNTILISKPKFTLRDDIQKQVDAFQNSVIRRGCLFAMCIN